MRLIDTDTKIREANDMISMCEVDVIQSEQALNKAHAILGNSYPELKVEIAVLRKLLHALNNAVGDLRKRLYTEV